MMVKVLHKEEGEWTRGSPADVVLLGLLVGVRRLEEGMAAVVGCGPGWWLDAVEEKIAAVTRALAVIELQRREGGDVSSGVMVCGRW